MSILFFTHVEDGLNGIDVLGWHGWIGRDDSLKVSIQASWQLSTTGGKAGHSATLLEEGVSELEGKQRPNSG